MGSEIKALNGSQILTGETYKRSYQRNVDPMDCRVLLLDDDPTYRGIVGRFAERKNIALTVCKDFAELKHKWTTAQPDVAIIDFYLDEDLYGPDIARLLGATPVVLVSRSTAWLSEGSAWRGQNIQTFFHKRFGVPKLLDTVLAISKRRQDDREKFAL